MPPAVHSSRLAPAAHSKSTAPAPARNLPEHQEADTSGVEVTAWFNTLASSSYVHLYNYIHGHQAQLHLIRSIEDWESAVVAHSGHLCNERLSCTR
jgi:hypothetical protein